jgi:SPP1 gp7 family putative phage head morphogenesis protein
MADRHVDAWVKETAKRLRKALDRLRKDNARGLLRVVIDDPASLNMTALENAVADARADIGTQARAHGWEQSAKQLRGAVEKQILDASINAGAHPDAVAFLEKAGAARVTELSAQSREALRLVLADMVEQNVPPAEQAKTIKQFVGLTSRDALAVERQRRRWLADGLDPDKVTSRVERMADRLLTRRATVIARTETLTALNEGHLLQQQRLVADGDLDPTRWEREWLTARDERTCLLCAPLNGETAPIDGPFSNGVFMPPLHPNCRCITRLVPRARVR